MKNNTYQYYPTPRSLAFRAFEFFKNRNITRLLEPSAGRGTSIEFLREFLEAKENERLAAKGFQNHHHFHRHYADHFPVDVVEIDQEHLPHLREKKFNLVGYDFLKFSGSPIYSHIFMNPPFAQGASHLLHAWNMLYDGEIVAILNAETIRNPYTKERQLLQKIIQDHQGEIEFAQGAFQTDDTDIPAQVEVAIVHLKKEANIQKNYIEGLRRDKKDSQQFQYSIDNQVAKHGDYTQKFQNLVIAFECAVEATRESIIAKIKQDYYVNILNSEVCKHHVSGSSSKPSEFQSLFSEQYHRLKESAWNGVLRSTEVLSRLNAEGQRRVESEMSEIAKLEFSLENIFGFLEGLIVSAPQIQVEMVCDVFDRISRYHSDNRCYYRGWKSNDRHRTLAFAVKQSRFILPVESSFMRADQLTHGSIQMLADFDKVFAMLDGQHYDPADPLAMANTQLVQGKRVASRYFDLRFFAGVGTIHFFPTRPDLIDRLNRIVGKHRQWLPANDNAAPAGFKQQFEQAEKLTKTMRQYAEGNLKKAGWNRPTENDLVNHGRLHSEASQIFNEAFDRTLSDSNISQDWLLASAADCSIPDPESILKAELGATAAHPVLDLLA